MKIFIDNQQFNSISEFKAHAMKNPSLGYEYIDEEVTTRRDGSKVVSYGVMRPTRNRR